MGSVRLAAVLAAFAAILSTPAVVRAETFHTCAGFIDSVPATITTQGVWCLRRDLSTAIASGSAISVAANNVTIDCNGFKLGGLAAGDASQASGILASDVQNATVRNCNIRGFARGVNMNQGGGHLVEDNRLDNILHLGILVCCGRDNLVQRNTIYDTGESPFHGSATAISVAGDIRGNTIRGVVARGSGVGRGINARIHNAVIRSNEISQVTSDAAGSSTAVGIYADGIAQTIENNVVSDLLSSPEGAAIGIHATSANAQVVGNRLSANSGGVYGIRGSAANTVCKDNTAVNFTTPFSSCEASEGNLAPP